MFFPVRQKTEALPSRRLRSPGTKSSHLKKLFNRWRPQLLCMVASILLYAAATSLLPAETELKNGYILSRNSYGQDSRSYRVTVEGIADEPVPLEIPVSPRSYREEEIGNIFNACMDELSVSILGDNPSLSEISGDLLLPSSLSQYGIQISWSSSDPELLSSYGTVRNEELRAPQDLMLTAFLTDAEGLYSAVYELPLTIFPRPLSPTAAQVQQFLSFLRQEDAAQSADAVLTLPTSYNGHSLRYSQAQKNNYWILLVLGPVVAILLLLRERQNCDAGEKRRKHQMLLDYPEIVSKLMVFIGAGMTIRLAWGNIVQDYEDDLAQGSGSDTRRYAYEAMSQALAKLKTGANEGRVYHEFGRSCGLRQYMKLSGILEQNRKTGIANIRRILSTEMNQAWEERKNLARRLGEEAGTKLLAPLFIMLLIVMVMIVVPAMLSF